MKTIFFWHIFSKRGKNHTVFSPENAEQRKALLTVVELVEMISTHPKMKHRFIVIKKHILINKPIAMLLTHRFL